MSEGKTISIKRSITVRAVVTPSWKEEAEKEISSAISSTDEQLAQLEKEGQQVISDVRNQSANPLDPRVQEQVSQIQQQVAAKRAELEEQKRNLLQQQSQVRELEMEQIVEQGQMESFFDLKVGDNLVEKMGVSILVRDGVVEAIDGVNDHS
ncbi:YlqD family protein [Prochlorococcus sp. MIT 1223]|uniref:YlqD family protein n=1 Tax=Prochlorococcus sp. MIT 1223 TaxID=3096217 RepID=UPI002A75DE5B|nr:YlqD family protein [Prochlorococcus sp. MIT 1223]